LAPFFAKRFSWAKAFVTWVIPVVPLMLMFDGVVSVLRTYDRSEIISLLPDGWDGTFNVAYYEVDMPSCPLKATVFALLRND
jgi:hypothetical protein